MFTTGLGTPAGFAAFILWIATNTDILARKRKWAVFDARVLFSGTSMEKLTKDLLDPLLRMANGELRTNTEIQVLRDGYLA